MSSREEGFSRRKLLRALAAGAGTGALAGCDSNRPHEGLFGRMERFNRGAQGTLFSPGRLAREPAVTDLTPEQDFPAYFVSASMPSVPMGWRLGVGGMVAHPAKFTLEELQSMPRTEVRERHHCVEGWSAVASWHGVRLRDLAARVGADPNARFVEFRSFDAGYWTSWDRESADHPQTLLAYGMNGHPLTPDHGAPLRVYSTTKLGYKNCKYLLEVNFLPAESGGWWEERGYEWYGGT